MKPTENEQLNQGFGYHSRIKHGTLIQGNIGKKWKTHLDVRQDMSGLSSKQFGRQVRFPLSAMSSQLGGMARGCSYLIMVAMVAGVALTLQ